MFTGIIESTGIVRDLLPNGSNLSFVIESALSGGLKVDQSISHNGVCLTIEEITGSHYKVTAIEETLKKTNLSTLQKGSIVNLEQCLQFNGRIDGHLVQGHVDTTALCTKRKEKKGSWEFEFEFAEKFSPLVIEKGSVCVNGISLTAFNVKRKKFTVAIIPYTFEHTNIKELKEGVRVNLEFDIIGKYLLRYIKNMEK
jgi:riboflavin synthase